MEAGRDLSLRLLRRHPGEPHILITHQIRESKPNPEAEVTIKTVDTVVVHLITKRIKCIII